MNHSPAQILAQALYDLETFVPPESEGWPLIAGHLPAQPDTCAVVYDRPGEKSGRYMKTGLTVVHPGFMLQVRDLDKSVAYAKIHAACKQLDTILRRPVTIGADEYMIASVTRMVPLAMGQDTEQRWMYSLNGRLTIPNVNDDSSWQPGPDSAYNPEGEPSWDQEEW